MNWKFLWFFFFFGCCVCFFFFLIERLRKYTRYLELNSCLIQWFPKSGASWNRVSSEEDSRACTLYQAQWSFGNSSIAGMWQLLVFKYEKTEFLWYIVVSKCLLFRCLTESKSTQVSAFLHISAFLKPLYFTIYWLPCLILLKQTA